MPRKTSEAGSVNAVAVKERGMKNGRASNVVQPIRYTRFPILIVPQLHHFPVLGWRETSYLKLYIHLHGDAALRVKSRDNSQTPGLTFR